MNNCKVWVYDANNLESVYETFSSMQKASDHFNVDYRSILKHAHALAVLAKAASQDCRKGRRHNRTRTAVT